MKKVANIVLNSFTNDSRVLKTSKSISSFGFHVLVIALHEADIPEKEVIQGVDVNRLKLNSRNWLKVKPIQLLKYLEFVLRAVSKCRKYDVIHCNDLDALLIGALIKILNKKACIIYDSHEFAINDVPNQSKISISFKYAIERILIRAADSVIAVSDSIGEKYSKIYGIPKPSTVLNCPNYQKSKRRDLFRATFNIRNDQKIFLYQGALSKGRGIDILLDVFSDMDNGHSVLIIMGYGPLEADIKKRSSTNSNVFFHPAVKPDVLLNYTGSADYGISFVEDVCLSYRYCLPNKMFEYIMSGIPVLVSNLPEMKRFVEVNGVGVVADENSKNGFKTALEKIGELNAELVTKDVLNTRRKFCWEEQERVLKRIYSGVKE